MVRSRIGSRLMTMRCRSWRAVVPVPALIAGALIAGGRCLAADPVETPALRYELEPAAPEIPHHHAGFFVGASTRFAKEEETETGLTLGMEYEYRFARAWGLGILAEGVVTSHGRDALLVVPFNWHPWEWLKLSAAPGVEFVSEEPEEFVMRLGVAYEFEFGRFNVAPEIAVDLTRESQSLVYGLSVGRRF